MKVARRGAGGNQTAQEIPDRRLRVARLVLWASLLGLIAHLIDGDKPWSGGIAERAAEENRDVLSASWQLAPVYYDPNVHRISAREQLLALLEEADRSGRSTSRSQRPARHRDAVMPVGAEADRIAEAPALPATGCGPGARPPAATALRHAAKPHGRRSWRRIPSAPYPVCHTDSAPARRDTARR